MSSTNSLLSSSSSLRQRGSTNANTISRSENTSSSNTLDDNQEDVVVPALIGCRKCRDRWEKEAATGGSEKLRDSRKYTVCDIAKHRTRESLWIHARGSVFDVTLFLHEHPGGDRAFIVNATGKSCDDDYDFHSSPAKSLWYKFKIGTVIQCDAQESPKHTSVCVII